MKELEYKTSNLINDSESILRIKSASACAIIEYELPKNM